MSLTLIGLLIFKRRGIHVTIEKLEVIRPTAADPYTLPGNENDSKHLDEALLLYCIKKTTHFCKAFYNTAATILQMDWVKCFLNSLFVQRLL